LRLLRFGRHFRIDSGLKIIIGKNEQENILLNNSYQNCYNIVNPVNFSGPTALISCPEEETSLWADKAGQLIIGYSGKKENSYTLNINKEKEVTLAYQEELFNILKKRKI